MASDEINLMLFAGELSTQDNLKHLHPELVAQIVKQVWPVAYTQGRADAWRWIPVSERLPERNDQYLCMVYTKLDDPEDSFTSYIVEVWIDGHWDTFDNITHWLPITLPGGEND